MMDRASRNRDFRDHFISMMTSWRFRVRAGVDDHFVMSHGLKLNKETN